MNPYATYFIEYMGRDSSDGRDVPSRKQEFAMRNLLDLISTNTAHFTKLRRTIIVPNCHRLLKS
jgi:hypothetical protein